MDICIRNISITPSTFEDLYYMPLADISFSLNAQNFYYADYINPFSGKIHSIEVDRGDHRHGSQKRKLLKNICHSFDLNKDEASLIYLKIIERLNNFLASDKLVKKDFPLFEELLNEMYLHGFYDRCNMRFGFMTIADNSEKYLFARDIKSAKDKLDYYLETGCVDEEYSYASAKQDCKNYSGVTLTFSRDDGRRCMPWRIRQEKWPGAPVMHYFATLRDAVSALPLPGTEQGYETESEGY